MLIGRVLCMKTVLPAVTPMQPIRAWAPFDSPDWVFELFHDGFRTLAHVEHGCCRLLRSNGHEINGFPELCLWIGEKLNVRDAVLDGELCCIGHDGRRVFDLRMSRNRLAYFYAFDILWLNRRDLRKWPLLRRKAKLKSILPRRLGPILYTGHTDGRGLKLFGIACNYALGGIIAKRKDSAYDCTEGCASWIKIVNPQYRRSQVRQELLSAMRRRISTA